MATKQTVPQNPKPVTDLALEVLKRRSLALLESVERKLSEKEAA